MAFQQGLSGLGMASRALDVISSNVANSATVGYKASSTIFADSFAAAMAGGTSNLQVGMGGNTQAVRQSFTQGATTTTNNPLDMAVAGNGFFVIQRTNGLEAFSRNGQFQMDKDGFVVTPLGEKLMGYQTVSGSAVSYTGSTAPRAIQIPPEGISAAATTTASLRANVDSQAVPPSTASPAVTTFDPTNPKSYNFTTSMTCYDSLGNQHTVEMFFVKRNPASATPPTVNASADPLLPNANTWDVYRTFDGKALTPDTTGSYSPSVSLLFNSSTGDYVGSFDPTTAVPTAKSMSINVTAATLGTGADPLAFGMDLAQMTQRRSASSVFETKQDGSPPGEVASVSVSSSGIVQARYTNGETRDLARVVLATFRNPNGLSSLGDNLWAQTRDSGDAAVAGPGDGLNGTISSGRVEESNVDMSNELVQMIVQQRNYQANAQSIKTQDQILQTLINLR